MRALQKLLNIYASISKVFSVKVQENMVLLIEYAHLETKGQKQEEFDSMTLKIKPRHKTNHKKHT